ncbi:hypothetical protein E1262_19530 [Jiangella aurantiaca]|uniref:Uncharacterized protein n=1 Tax=Jiangella aurantiaca TaxID=2530373 RepID=A0A4R5A5I1_9ACTN|nr:hypothetical protein [Jiangella aurantiaca]TDD67288.1 hypothetical protein E1262_19530 [Jiangella aurantiaca]
MSDLDLETALRATLADHAGWAPAGDELADTVTRTGLARRKRRRVAAAAAALVAGVVAGLAGSGYVPFAGEPEPAATQPAEDLVATLDPDLATCWGNGPGFDPALLTERPLVDPASALGTAVRTGPPPPATPAIVAGATLVEQTGSTAYVLIWLTDTDEARSLFDTDVLGARYEQAPDGAWSSQGGGACYPQRTPDDGLVLAEWWLRTTPGPDATSVTIQVQEEGCSGGMSPADRLAEAIVEYRADAVVITARIEPLPDGAYTCQGSPPAPLTVQLDEPLGDRQLLDGKWVPARPPTVWP